ncbi:uncharacterized protein LOC124156196 isoform X2 [Ischnura elegans]|uniref:uncharacterized protein LOC124156196 isoform X2 n=1 Tax=Ischnura elegans TaxID=197161 RepID=UPI001ED8BDAB|nr:uncharacterized protein LOC124156196 isoform X2 [Ischnura elegans]
MKWWTILLAIIVGVNVASAYVTIRTSVDESANCKDRFKGRIEYSSDCQPASKHFIKKIHEGFLTALYRLMSATGGGLNINFTPKHAPSHNPHIHHGKPKGVDAQTQTGGDFIVVPIDELNPPLDPKSLLDSKPETQSKPEKPKTGSTSPSGWQQTVGVQDQPKQSQQPQDGKTTLYIPTDYPVTSTKSSEHVIPGKTHQQPNTEGQKKNPQNYPSSPQKTGGQTHFRHPTNVIHNIETSHIPVKRPNIHDYPTSGQDHGKPQDVETSGQGYDPIIPVDTPSTDQNDAFISIISGSTVPSKTPYSTPTKSDSDDSTDQIASIPSSEKVYRDPKTGQLTRLIPVDPHTGKVLPWSPDFHIFQETEEPKKPNFDDLSGDEDENPFLTQTNQGGQTEGDGKPPLSDDSPGGKDMTETVIKGTPYLYDPSTLPGVPSGKDTTETTAEVETIIKGTPYLYDPSKLPGNQGTGYHPFIITKPWSSESKGHKIPTDTDDPFQSFTNDDQDIAINISPKGSYHDVDTHPVEPSQKPEPRPANLWIPQDNTDKKPAPPLNLPPRIDTTETTAEVETIIKGNPYLYDPSKLPGNQGTGYHPFIITKPWSSESKGHKIPTDTDDPFQSFTNDDQDIAINISPKSSYHDVDTHPVEPSQKPEPRPANLWIQQDKTDKKPAPPLNPPPRPSCGPYCCQQKIKVPTPKCNCPRA